MAFFECKSFLLRLLNHYCKTLEHLKQVQALIATSPSLSDPHRFFLTTRLLFFCAVTEYGSVAYASRVFRQIHTPNLFVYNAMIRGYSCKSNGPTSQSFVLYKQMLRAGILPSRLTFPFMLKECTRSGDLLVGGAVYGHAVKLGFDADVYIRNAMIALYCECGDMASARKVFDEMCNRDVVSWNSIIGGCFRNGYPESALDLFRGMGERSIYTWNSIITGCVKAGLAREALEFFQEMMSEGAVEPDKLTISGVLTACASLGAVDHGRWVHGYLKRIELTVDVVIGTALIDMYGKSGCVDRAVEVFKEMKEKDVLAWTAMMSVFSFNGYAREALDLLEDMDTQGLKPNHVTFVALLSACAHSGLVEEGRWCFNVMRNVHMIEPQVYHYAGMVGVLSRAGLFEEAESVIQSMPMQPDAFIWGALLGGCQMHGHTDLGEKVALKLIDLEPLNYAFYVNLCDVYAKAGRFKDVKKIRALMQEKGMKKEIPGCSMIEVDGIVHEFSVRGASQVVMEEIALVLDRLVGQMKLDIIGIDI